jgi:hypothetical protein
LSTVKKNRIKTQVELSQEQVQPYDGTNPPLVENRKRAEQRKVLPTDSKSLTLGLQDIDQSILYYFKNVIKPSAVQNGIKVEVPVVYGSPERWNSIQKDGFYRDKNGKIITPLIMFKRDSVEKNRTLGNKLDANQPNNFQVFEKKYTKKNVYDKFSLLNNREPVKEYQAVVIPDYINLVYSCIIFTDYVEQMNKIVESINYASDAYWGDPEKFKFRAMIDNYTMAVELNQGQDRAVKTTFSINLYGYVIPDGINAYQGGSNKFFSKSRINFKLETIDSFNTLMRRAKTQEKQASRRFFDTALTMAQQTGMTPQQIIYLTTNNSAIANTTVNNLSTFTNRQFLTPPPGFNIEQDDFVVFVNGIAIKTDHRTIQQVGNDITVTFLPNLVGYNVNGNDTVILSGKIT